MYIDNYREYVNFVNMTARDQTIVEAAMRVFTRYGVKRTGMNDIAEEAGIARQTLYNNFKNKDEVLCATIRFLCDAAIESVRNTNANSNSVAEKLDAILDEIAVKPFQRLHALPNSEDIIDGFNTAGRAELEIAHERFRQVIEETLAPYAKKGCIQGVPIHEFSDFIRVSASAAKKNARDEAHLNKLLGALKSSVLAIIRAR